MGINFMEIDFFWEVSIILIGLLFIGLFPSNSGQKLEKLMKILKAYHFPYDRWYPEIKSLLYFSK
jgi:hypothetical protein